MRKKGLETSELLCRIFLEYPKDYIIIENEQSFIESLWRLSFKPPYAALFGRTSFSKAGGNIKSPELSATLNEMIGFMIVPDENIPDKYNLDRSELRDYVSKFESSSFDNRYIKKIGEIIDKKLSAKWEYSEMKKRNTFIKESIPKVEPREEKTIADEI